MDTLNLMIAFEQGELSDEMTTELFKRLINDGTLWGLQGSYVRAAQALIEEGYLEIVEVDWQGNFTVDHGPNSTAVH